MTTVVPGALPAEFLLYPNRSLSTPGFVVVMAALTVVSAGVAGGFLLIGAWPVTGFLCFDVLAVFLAFTVVRRRSRCHELIRIAPTELVVRRVSPRGQSREVAFDPYWAKVQLEGRRERPRLSVGSHGRRCEIGRFLTAGEKRELAAALADALRRCR